MQIFRKWFFTLVHAGPLRWKIIFHSICEAFSCCVIGEDISDEQICHGLRLRRVFLTPRQVCCSLTKIKWYSDWVKTLAATSSWWWNYFHLNLTASAFSQRKCKWSGELIHDRSSWPAVLGWDPLGTDWESTQVITRLCWSRDLRQILDFINTLSLSSLITKFSIQ